MQAFIRLLYSLLVGATVVAFAALTVYSFYQPPKAPHYPEYSCYNLNYNNSAVEQAAYNACDKAYQKANDAASKKRNNDSKHYQRQVTYVLMPLAVLSAVAGLVLIRRSGVIGEGLALGGAGISAYAIITASLAEARILRFFSASLLLLTVLGLAHLRFKENGKKS